jgi:hypothetical protein
MYGLAVLLDDRDTQVPVVAADRVASRAMRAD